jgi:hypothetical protein
VKYPVPCECGKTLRVTATQAGMTLRCECGRDVEVPSLRQLRHDPDGPVPTARLREVDRSAPRVIGTMLIVVGLALSCLSTYVLFPDLRDQGDRAGSVLVGWVVSLLASAGSALITHSKGFPVWATVLLALICPCAAVVILFLPDRA